MPDNPSVPPEWAAPGDDRPVHFVGIAGVGMSALAELLARRGIRVSGCDAFAEPSSDLARLGVTFSGVHDPQHVAGVRAVVATSAVPRSHPELEHARNAGLPVLRRADALAAVIGDAQIVGISGTHGKTTTTALATDALVAAGLNPTGIAGGRVAAWGGNLWRGSDDLFVVEADEYDRSFLALIPDVALVTNVEADHLDVYAGIDDIKRAFEEFIRPARVVVVCCDDHAASTLAMPNSAEVIRYGVVSGDARLRATALRGEGGVSRFEVVYDGASLGEIRLAVPGRHNVLNALGAIGCGIAAGATLEQMLPGIEAFAGVERRFQRLGAAGGVAIVDDYAHHPSEIIATLDAARAAFSGARVVVAFQPHLFSRTRDFASEFATALSGADVIFLADIYPAREHPIPGVTSDLIADGVVRLGHPVAWQGDRAALAAALAGYVRPGDVVLTLGAGDITRAAHELRDLLRAKATA